MQATGPISYSEIESRRFGLRVFRGAVETVEPERLAAALLAEDVDVAILRMPSAQQPWLAILDATGFPYVVADTLVYHELDLARHAALPPENRDLEFVQCGPEHAAELRPLVERVFAGYANHYLANPVLRREDIREAYVDWALRYATAREPGRSGWLVRRGGANVAFMTGMRDGERCEVVLGGVDPEARGGGVYGDFMRFAIRHYQDAGCRLMTVSTQTQNVAVQRAWSRMGFELARSVVTVHVNSLLSHSAVAATEYELAVSGNGELRCVAGGGLVGTAWSASGGARQWPLAPIAAALSDCGASILPGTNPAVRRGSFSIREPMEPGSYYRLKVSLPVFRSAERHALALARVTDTHERTCLLCHAELRW